MLTYCVKNYNPNVFAVTNELYMNIFRRQGWGGLGWVQGKEMVTLKFLAVFLFRGHISQLILKTEYVVKGQLVCLVPKEKCCLIWPEFDGDCWCAQLSILINSENDHVAKYTR